ncbi:MAG: hypothetical protein WBM06_08670, partial [Pseudolabrys sp.]
QQRMKPALIGGHQKANSLGVRIIFRVLHTLIRDSSVTRVLHNRVAEGKCYARHRPKGQISSYFRPVIAVP